MDSSNPAQTRCYDACPNPACFNTRRDVAVLEERLDALDARLTEFKQATDVRLDDLHEGLTDFHTQQSETNGRLVGNMEQLLKQQAQLSKLIVEGNGQASVLNRLADVEHQYDDVAKGLNEHVTQCGERHKRRQSFGHTAVNVIGGIIAAVLGGVVTYVVGGK